ncbi:MAG: hypothetical protein AB7P17_01485 [Nitrospirales bacterium]|nr:hypothetical protein [Nitrospirales bacterium]
MSSHPQPHFSLTDRLRSGYHRVWYEASQALRWSRGTFREQSTGTLTQLTNAQFRRVDDLAAIYHRRFEANLPPETAFLNYAYLDLLDRAKHALKWAVPTGQHVCDLGSANFAYAAALSTFFQPIRLVGVEVDGYRLYCNGRSRLDYARGHIQDLPRTDYVVADYRQFNQSAHFISAWFPFVTPQPLLAWRLPLSLFDPNAILARVANNLIVGGTFAMINHSLAEARVAHHLVEATGLVCQGCYIHEHPLRPRPQPAVLTLWQQS